MNPSNSIRNWRDALLLAGACALASGPAAAQFFPISPDDLIPSLKSLKDQPVPPVPGIEEFIRDPAAAVALGKALFWDLKVGSDGQACASCHFHAGADSRMKNQLSPGLKGGDTAFGTAPAQPWGPNYTLQPNDFPLHRLADPLDRNSAELFTTNDVVSSSGTFDGDFAGLVRKGGENCATRDPDSFMVHGKFVRKVEPRNTPTTINAVFNFRNFWDGRANNIFNGVSPFGPRDPDARVLRQNSDRTLSWVPVALRNASLASQAVGPPLSDFEMSCAAKGFKDLGRKLLPLRALSTQEVHATDSVLAPYRHPHGKGLKQSYEKLIKAAFAPQWWEGKKTVDGYTQIEHNFSLFWGLAIQAYEATLVSDEAPIDRFFGDATTPPDSTALTVGQQRGMGIFTSNGFCINCHRGPELTSAASTLHQLHAQGLAIERMAMAAATTDFAGAVATYDSGFYNIGVRPTAEDRGVGATDPWGQPLSFARQYLDKLRGLTVPDQFPVNACLFEVPGADCLQPPDPDSERVAVDGSFKTPTLRNISLTAPYFHNGSRLTLEQVVEFYNRGGDRRGPDGNDSTGYTGPDAPNGGSSNLDQDIRVLHPVQEPNALTPKGLSAQQKADLVDFLRHALTDSRVACESAPFDHPALPIPHGHVGDHLTVVDADGDGKADDEFLVLPAVGAAGRAAATCLHHDDGSAVVGSTP